MAEDTTRPDYARLLAGQASLAGRVAFVPGGYGGIGEAIAWGLALAGARVAVAGRDRVKAEAFAARLGAAGHDAIGVAMDAHSLPDIRVAVDGVAGRFGGLDLLVNCVGIQREERHADVSEAAFDEVAQVNLKAAMFMSQTAARHQVAAIAAGRPAGRQVHLLSVRAQLGVRDRGYSAYCATKGALIQLAKVMAADHAVQNIRVNTLSPGAVETRRMVLRFGDMQTARQVSGPLHLLKRLGQPDEIAAAAIFLASDASSFMTGADLLVDGGYTAV